jgi:hypothetical protein
VEEDGVYPALTRGEDVWLDIVREEHLVRLHAETPPRPLVDAPVRLAHALLMRVDDEVGHRREAEARLLLAPRADEAVAQQRGLVARTQTLEVRDQLSVGFAHIDIPEVAHESGHLRVIHPTGQAQLRQFRTGPD